MPSMSDVIPIAEIQRQLNATQYITMVSVGILYYDYFLTLAMEVDRFWSLPKITWASSLFYLNRYLSLLGHLPVVFVSFWGPADPMDKVVLCRYFLPYRQAFAVAIQVAAGILQIIRTYAFYERCPWVLSSLILIGSGVIAFGSWCVISEKHHTVTTTFMPRLGCFESVSAADGIRLAEAWGGVLVWEISIFALTLYKSLTLSRIGNRTLLNILLRDGSMYFAVIVIATLSNILTCLNSPPIIKGFTTTLTNVLSAILISRLMLNLRDPTLTHRQHYTTDDNPFVSTIVDVEIPLSRPPWMAPESRCIDVADEGIRPWAIELEERNKT